MGELMRSKKVNLLLVEIMLPTLVIRLDQDIIHKKYYGYKINES
jgi:hypothetical protein